MWNKITLQGVSSNGVLWHWYMLKNTYDTNGNWKVDDADKVNWLAVETAVPANAIFTDTTYTDGEIKTKYENNSNTNALTDALKTLLETKKVKNVTTDATNNKLVITYTDDTTANLNINDIVTDIYVNWASLDASTNVLTLTAADGGADVTVDLSDFVNSSELNNALTNKSDNIVSPVENNVLVQDTNWNLKDWWFKNTDIVHMAWDETIDWNKTFSKNLVVNADVKGASITMWDIQIRSRNEIDCISWSKDIHLWYQNTKNLYFYTWWNDSIWNHTMTIDDTWEVVINNNLRVWNWAEGSKIVMQRWNDSYRWEMWNDSWNNLVLSAINDDNTVREQNALYFDDWNWNNDTKLWIWTSTPTEKLDIFWWLWIKRTSDNATISWLDYDWATTSTRLRTRNKDIVLSTVDWDRNSAEFRVKYWWNIEAKWELKTEWVRTRAGWYKSESLTWEQVRYWNDVTYRITDSRPSNNENFWVIIKEYWAQYNTTNIWNSTKAIMVKQPWSWATVVEKVNSNLDHIWNSRITTTITAIDSANFDVKLSIGDNYTNAMLELHTISTSWYAIITKQ